jgi:hypothetical protein
MSVLAPRTYIQRWSKNKYHNRRTGYHGTSYMSNKEADKAWELDQLKNNGDIKNWTKQFKLSIDVNGQHITNYYLDFMIEENDGTFTYLEIKSPITMTDTWKLKWKLSQALFTDPNIKWVVEI